jgi:hypothetical protein
MAKKSNILSTNERKANVLLVAEHLKVALFLPAHY